MGCQRRTRALWRKHKLNNSNSLPPSREDSKLKKSTTVPRLKNKQQIITRVSEKRRRSSSQGNLCPSPKALCKTKDWKTTIKDLTRVVEDSQPSATPPILVRKVLPALPQAIHHRHDHAGAGDPAFPPCLTCNVSLAERKETRHGNKEPTR